MAAYTDEHIRVLREVYPAGGSAAVHALLPEHSPGSIRVKAHQLGVRTRVSGSLRVWTDAEDAVLREHYRSGGVAACAALLSGRSQNSIYARADVLGLSRSQAPALRRSA
ncbi:hypothetical protein [Rhodopseudomonas palustris]|uniref:hypothetical protein n=1 Tax=Rhodopseudomonas palustris TaxID=1076 RepID=UPI0021F2E4AF|nr:hypothetical protein [Rhodopseudomonas palustris]UYO55191.1 hypothetical protein KQX61_07250 [Rhodopseudomonas palustris]